ncbi:hypothetical protein [Variovorax saccharolyticus]|uniref:hypothetical protein n=1 Tax=Variovorax saccharolyticus TaxID=3053516 RepID=UPI00257563EB|nr:hypothetical protein [Variovorax sp. J22R187]MDM0018388.1 hypothetical protein [Variovorax sp. J22R187]
MIYESDARFLRAMIVGRIDSLADGAMARLAVLRAKYSAALDGGMLDLIARARETHAEAVARAEVAADRAFLEGLIDGTEDLLSEDTFPKLEPMFTRYAEGSEMFALLEKAATIFGDAAQELASWVIAGEVIHAARCGWGDDE